VSQELAPKTLDFSEVSLWTFNLACLSFGFALVQAWPICTVLLEEMMGDWTAIKWHCTERTFCWERTRYYI